jgi:hypothetical protein
MLNKNQVHAIDNSTYVLDGMTGHLDDYGVRELLIAGNEAYLCASLIKAQLPKEDLDTLHRFGHDCDINLLSDEGKWYHRVRALVALFWNASGTKSKKKLAGTPAKEST